MKRHPENGQLRPTHIGFYGSMIIKTRSSGKGRKREREERKWEVARDTTFKGEVQEIFFLSFLLSCDTTRTA
jgi:hypothetical protein